MQDFPAKSNVAGAADSLTATTFGGGEAHCVLTENKTAVTRSGQTLDASGTNTNLNQLSKALWINGAGAGSFVESGAANAYVVTPVTGTSGLYFANAYALLTGCVISFIPGNANTGASTLNIGQTTGTLLGTKKILSLAGADLSGGELDTTYYHEFIDDPTADSGTGAWIFIGKKRPQIVAFYDAYGKWVDRKSSGSAGGSASNAGTWETRVLNYEVVDDEGIGTLASNRVTLGAGTYIVYATAPMYETQEHCAQLYDFTGGALLVQGTSERSASGVVTRSIISGQFTLAVSSAVYIRQYYGNNEATNGLGYPVGSGGYEYYTTLEIWRKAT